MTKRVALLSGASGLVGSALIRRCAESYHIIAVHHRGEVRFATQDQAFVDPLVPLAPVAGNEHAVHSVRADLTNPIEIERLVQEAVQESGNIDLLVNAAAQRSSSPVLRRTALDGAETLFAVNVLAPLRLAALLGRTIWRADPDANARENRNVINVSSRAGGCLYEDQGQAVFSSACAALNHLTFHLASELWHIGIRVNAVQLDLSYDSAAIDHAIDVMIELDRSTETGQIRDGWRHP